MPSNTMLILTVKQQHYCIHTIFFFFYNQGTFHDQALWTLHGDPNLGVLTVPQQPAVGYCIHTILNSTKE